MSAAQSRYSTLVRYATGIYSAGDSQERTAVMSEALNQVVSVSSDWTSISRDSDRLLKVWLAKEQDPAAGAVADQITDLLKELALEKTEVPALKITEPPSVITHIPEPVPMVKIVKIEDSDAETIESSAPSTKEEEEAVEETVEEETAEEEAVEEEAVEEEAVEEEAVEEEAVEEEAVEEEAVEEEEEEEEEEVGLEVEKRMIRGVPYWLEVNTHKLYAVIDDDDVGDEVGELVGGKPQFYA